MNDFGTAYWKRYKYYESVPLTGGKTAHTFKVVLNERDAIHLGIDDRKEWPHADAGERKEYGVVFIR